MTLSFTVNGQYRTVQHKTAEILRVDPIFSRNIQANERLNGKQPMIEKNERRKKRGKKKKKKKSNKKLNKKRSFRLKSG